MNLGIQVSGQEENGYYGFKDVVEMNWTFLRSEVLFIQERSRR